MLYIQQIVRGYILYRVFMAESFDKIISFPYLLFLSVFPFEVKHCLDSICYLTQHYNIVHLRLQVRYKLLKPPSK